uniref:Uncharacterized protein n=1 Tax=Panagrolaimus sp. PS1159 TaxID=55785 RepID=A0AC35FM06_9BILA
MARLPLTELSLVVIIFTAFSLAFDGTHVRLVQPAARISERGFNVSRNAEAPCPTIRQEIGKYYFFINLL